MSFQNSKFVIVNKRELNEFKEILRKQQELVMSSKEAARELLNSLGMLTPGGKLKKSFKASPGVSR